MLTVSNTTPYRTMTEMAAQRLLEAIITGELPPGTRLIPSRLEKEMNLSKVSIREALREISGMGLVVSLPNKGAVVSEPPELEEIIEIFEIRFLLEGKAAEVATHRIDNKGIEQIQTWHKEMTKQIALPRTYFHLNREFHLRLYKESKMNHLCQIIEQMMNKVQSFRSRYPFRKTDYRIFNQGHEDIIEALVQRDAIKVKERVIANVRSGLDTLMKVYQNAKAANK